MHPRDLIRLRRCLFIYVKCASHWLAIVGRASIYEIGLAHHIDIIFFGLAYVGLLRSDSSTCFPSISGPCMHLHVKYVIQTNQDFISVNSRLSPPTHRYVHYTWVEFEFL